LPIGAFSRLGRMPRATALSLAVGLAAAATALASCGGENAKLLPGETAREITANLDTVKQLANEGDCIGAESASEQVGEQIEELSGIDPKLKRALQAGAARLNEVITSCEESEAIAPAEIPTEVEGEEEEASKKRGKKPKQEETTTAPEPGTPPTTTPTEPPSSNEGGESEPGGAEEGGEPSSGGVGPGAPAGGGE